MDKLESIALFCQVAQLGSFTAVANKLNVTQSSVSKKIAWLESQLEITLLHRTSRKVTLTEQGQAYLDYATDLLDRMEQTESRLKGELSEVTGKLSITAPSAFVTEKLASPIAEFMKLHPKVTVYLSVEDKQIDFANSQFDIAIRAALLKDSDLKAKKLLDHQVCYFAAPSYISQHEAPHSAEEIEQHRCITYNLSSPSNVWQLNGNKYRVREAFSSDNPEVIVKMAKLGVGIAAMPKWMVEEELTSGQLVELFGEVEKPSLPMYALYKNSEYLPYRIRAFIDFIANYFAQ